MSGTPMTQEEYNELATLKQKETDGTLITQEEIDRLAFLRDNFQCD